MPVPSPRKKILPARGNIADLQAGVGDLLDGEICYAIDQDQYYQKEGAVLVSVGATKAQGSLADSAIQPGDNVSDLVNDAGYITVAQVPGDAVTSVNTQTGDVVLDTDDISQGSANLYSQWDDITGGIGYASGDVLIGGTLPLAPNITLNADGAITAGTYNSAVVKAIDTNNYVFGRDTTGAAITTGIDNIAIGALALQNTTEGNANVAVGSQALKNNVTGLRNTCVGNKAGQQLTLNDNTIIGRIEGDASLSSTIILGAGSFERLRIDSTGSLMFGGTLPSAPNFTIESTGEITTLEDATINGVIIGRGSGDFTTNTALGRGALVANTTGAGNTATGTNSLSNNTEGENNTAVGRSALLANTTGTNSTAVGLNSLSNNTEGSNNTALGVSTLTNSITGDYNTAVGRYALNNLTSGDNNTFIGSYRGEATLSDTVSISAGQTEKLRIDSTGSLLFGGTLPSAPNVTIESTGAITAAVDATINGATVGLGGGSNQSNAALGVGALSSNTTGLFNTAIGRLALSANIDANSNTAVGHNTLLVNTTGAANTAIGRQALAANTEGVNNVGVGFRSLYVNTTGKRNTAIGDSSLQSNLTGSDNTAIGRFAGRYIEGSNNTIIGPYQGTTADSTLNDTVIISAGQTEKLRIDSTGSLLFGGTLPGTPNVTINSDGSAEFAGKITSDSTVSGDAGTILATKDYVDAATGGINPTIAGMIF